MLCSVLVKGRVILLNCVVFFSEGVCLLRLKIFCFRSIVSFEVRKLIVIFEIS